MEMKTKDSFENYNLVKGRVDGVLDMTADRYELSGFENLYGSDSSSTSRNSPASLEVEW